MEHCCCPVHEFTISVAHLSAYQCLRLVQHIVPLVPGYVFSQNQAGKTSGKVLVVSVQVVNARK